MHIPDGMLSTQVAAASALAGAGFIGYAVRWAKRQLSERTTVLVSVMAALVFALQMLNFPIAPGISGHFAGGAAAAILLGPWAAVIVMTTVLLVQALVFADGGVVALGANVVNLAVIGPLAGYAVWRLLRSRTTAAATNAVAAFASAWVAVVASSLAVGFEVWLSGRAPLGPALAALGGWHAIVGIGEGAITAGLVGFVRRVRPDLVDASAGRRADLLPVAVTLGALALLASALSWLASTRPDALEFVAASGGFESALDPLASPLADYAVPGIPNEALAGALAGVVGVLVVGAALFAFTGALASRRVAAHRDGLHQHRHEHSDAPEHAHPHHHPAQGHEHAHPLSFERYTYIVSPVHALDARAKTVGALALVLGIVIGAPPRPLEFALIAAGLLLVTAVARVPVEALLGRSLVVLPVAITLALFAPLTPLGWPLAWAIVGKSWLSALTIVVLSATTSPPRLLAGLRALGLPAVFVATLTFLYRYTSLLAGQIVAMRRAIASRGADLSARRRVALLGNLAGSLFVRSYERGERLHSAMLSRGFTGTLPAGASARVRVTDIAVAIAGVLAGFAIVLY